MPPSFKLQISISPSMLNFVTFLIIAVALTIFLVKKTDQAVSDIEKINNTTYMDARREAGITPVQGISPSPKPAQ